MLLAKADNAEEVVATAEVVGVQGETVQVAQVAMGNQGAVFYPNACDEIQEKHKSSKKTGGLLFLGAQNTIGCDSNVQPVVWVPPTKIHVHNVLRGVTIDFRRAEFIFDTVHVDIGNLMGGVDIKVPAGVEVKYSGLGILGGFNAPGASSSLVRARSPKIVIRGFHMLGGVKVEEDPSYQVVVEEDQFPAGFS